MSPDEPSTPPLRPLPLLRWIWQLANDVVSEYRSDGVGDLAAAITFWTLLSIPAAVLALVSALSSTERFFGASAAQNLEEEVQQFIADTFTDSEALSDAVAELFNGGQAGVITVATAIAVFSLSRGFAGLIRALDRAYEVEEGRSWLHLRVVAIALGVATVVVAAGSSLLLAILPELGGSAWRVWAIPIVLAVLVMWATTLFHVGPFHRTPWRYDLPGALVTTAGWLLASQGFVYYVRIASGGNQVQSTVGTVLLGFTLMYALSVVLLVGAEVNDVIARRAGVTQQPVPVRERYDEVVDLLQERRSGAVGKSDRRDGSSTTTDDPR